MKHEQLTFEDALYKYVEQVASPFRDRSSTEQARDDLVKQYGASRTQSALATLHKQRQRKKETYCLNWDDKDNIPHYLFDAVNLRIVGILVPVDYELISNSPGKYRAVCCQRRGIRRGRTVMMTRKHFEGLAAVIAEHTAEAPRNEGLLGDEMAESIGLALAEYLSSQNPNFDRARFLKACGL